MLSAGSDCEGNVVGCLLLFVSSASSPSISFPVFLAQLLGLFVAMDSVSMTMTRGWMRKEATAGWVPVGDCAILSSVSAVGVESDALSWDVAGERAY